MRFPLFCVAMVITAAAVTAQPVFAIQGELIRLADVSLDSLPADADSDANVLIIDVGSNLEDVEQKRDQLEKIHDQAVRHKRKIGWWIEVARCQSLADSHPQWMASLQGHGEWHRRFPKSAMAQAGEVVKVYPWVPIANQPAFDAQLQRIQKLLQLLPAADFIFLNDLQAAPSACGCGNDLCRWTTDYGPIKAGTPVGADAAAKFCGAIQADHKSSKVIPVWTTECEKVDGEPDGHCAGVGCFDGICWQAYTEQLMPVTDRHSIIGVQILAKEFDRATPQFDHGVTWVRSALGSFQAMPPVRSGRAIAANRLLPILQGWDISPEQLQRQITECERMGTSGYIIAKTRIDQSWTPQVVTVSRE